MKSESSAKSPASTHEPGSGVDLLMVVKNAGSGKVSENLGFHFGKASQHAVMRLFLPFWFPLFALVLPSCSMVKAGKKRDSTTPPAESGPVLIGRIASIPPEKRFALIQSYEKWNIETGTILTTRGMDDRTANLLVTGEALGQFAAADIQSGSVEIGDAVYSQRIPKAAETPATIGQKPQDPETKQEGKTENAQKNN
jgi:hypothetical protein